MYSKTEDLELSPGMRVLVIPIVYFFVLAVIFYVLLYEYFYHSS